MIKLLLMNKNIDIQVVNEHGVNAYWIACMYGHGVVMSTLAEHDINLFCINRYKVNVLHLAVSRNYVGIVETLLESGFPLEHETNKGMTAFQIAAHNGHTQIIELMIKFLKHCGSEELKNNILNKVNPYTHLSTLAYSILKGNNEISTLLIEFGAQSYYSRTDEEKDFSPIFMAVQRENTKLLELMCDHKAKLTVKNSVGMTPLMFAAE